MVDTTIIDFTNCQIDTSAQYGGSDQKRGIFYKDKRYMLKMPDRIDEVKRNQWNSSYSNSVYSEKVCCDILKALGFSVQNVLLGFIIVNNNKKPVVACENFVPLGATLLSFKTIANSLLPEKLGKIPKIAEIYSVLEQPSSYFSKEAGAAALQEYWNLFILDALLGNFDRHADNWGYFSIAGRTSLVSSPIYDCGSCLYPQIADEAISGILADENEIIMRVDKFPTAALLLENNRKANYKDYIQSLVNPDCTAALSRIYPRIDLTVINNVIDSEPLSDIRKDFYKVMLRARFERILMSAYHSIYSQTSFFS